MKFHIICANFRKIWWKKCKISSGSLKLCFVFDLLLLYYFFAYRYLLYEKPRKKQTDSFWQVQEVQCLPNVTHYIQKTWRNERTDQNCLVLMKQYVKSHCFMFLTILKWGSSVKLIESSQSKKKCCGDEKELNDAYSTRFKVSHTRFQHFCSFQPKINLYSWCVVDIYHN